MLSRVSLRDWTFKDSEAIGEADFRIPSSWASTKAI